MLSLPLPNVVVSPPACCREPSGVLSRRPLVSVSGVEGSVATRDTRHPTLQENTASKCPGYKQASERRLWRTDVNRKRSYKTQRSMSDARAALRHAVRRFRGPRFTFVSGEGCLNQGWAPAALKCGCAKRRLRPCCSLCSDTLSRVSAYSHQGQGSVGRVAFRDKRHLTSGTSVMRVVDLSLRGSK